MPRTVNKDFIKIVDKVIDAYEKDSPNLMKRSNQTWHATDENKQDIGYWPSAKYLRDRTMFGSLVGGMDALGNTNDSPGSDLLIKLADEKDDRPIWIHGLGRCETRLPSRSGACNRTGRPSNKRRFCRKSASYTITDQGPGRRGGVHASVDTHHGRERPPVYLG